MTTELELLSSRFDHESSDAFATPSGNYYWYRKFHQVVSVLERTGGALRRPGVAVVDLGCGTGVDLFLIRRVLGVRGHFLGIEGDPTALRTCELRAQYHGAADVCFLEHDLTHGIPLPDGKTDLAYCSEVVEHLPNPEALIAEMARVLKPRGYLLLTTPNQPSVLQRSFWSRRRKATHMRQIETEREKIRESAERAGTTPIYGHISLRTVKAWDQTVTRFGLELIDFGRGALIYGSRPLVDQEPVLGAMFLVQAALDALPKRLTRSVSDQVIALYQKPEEITPTRRAGGV